jgi:alkaline phosphatase D
MFSILNSRTVVCFLFLTTCFVSSASAQESSTTIKTAEEIETVLSRIAFGSCGHQDHDQPVLDTVVSKKPDLFIYLGDNIYGDTKDMNVLKAKYDKLGSRKEFQNLRANVPTLSVWDDHDYGWNDAGKEYEFKGRSKDIFMDFWKVPSDSWRREHPGIYGSHFFSDKNRSVQIILLDTRTFRDPLKRNPKKLPEGSVFKNAYQPDESAEKTLLGDEQWKWLLDELKKQADLRIVCTSIQFGHEYNGWESWTNMPLQQQKMVDTIRDAKANGVVFISGDVHWGEISKREFDNVYPLYDVTASGLTMDWHNTEPNKFRIGEVWRKNHFGMIDIDWSAADPQVTMQIIDVDGEIRNSHGVALSTLKFAE